MDALAPELIQHLYSFIKPQDTLRLSHVCAWLRLNTPPKKLHECRFASVLRQINNIKYMHVTDHYDPGITYGLPIERQCASIRCTGSRHILFRMAHISSGTEYDGFQLYGNGKSNLTPAIYWVSHGWEYLTCYTGWQYNTIAQRLGVSVIIHNHTINFSSTGLSISPART